MVRPFIPDRHPGNPSGGIRDDRGGPLRRRGRTGELLWQQTEGRLQSLGYGAVVEQHSGPLRDLFSRSSLEAVLDGQGVARHQIHTAQGNVVHRVTVQITRTGDNRLQVSVDRVIHWGQRELRPAENGQRLLGADTVSQTVFPRWSRS